MTKRSFQDHSGILSFGRYLKAVREHQGISLESVAAEIRVSPRQLTWIEAEDHDRMPAEVYTRGILRAYARAVGVDPEDIVERYQIHRAAHEQSVRQEAEILTSGRKTVSRMFLALGVLAVIMALTLYFYGSGEHGSADYRASQETREEVSGKAGQKTQGNNASPSSPADDSTRGAGGGQEALEADLGGRQRLSIDAVSEVTIKIRVDEEPYTKYRLDPNDHMELAAQSRFHIFISDSAGIRLHFNGQPVEIASEPGHSAELTLPQQSGRK
ncbi:MAG: helix-turn-helix domain-containing protein [Desulfobacterales bacterium]